MEQAEVEARQRLHREWTKQLYQEFGHVLWSARLTFPTPLIRIAPLHAKLGEWDPLTRTITLAERLINEHPWDIVIEVLKHEIAHMMVSDDPYGGAGRPHGQLFLAACDRLGVSAWGARASGELPDSPPQGRTRPIHEDEARLLKKVDKLLALSASSNEHEAALAMQRVQELYARYNLEQARAAGDTEVVYAIIDRKSQRMEATERSILSLLGQHFFVKVILGKRYDAKDLRGYRVAEIFGTPENVAMAEYVFDFLWRSIHELWAAHRDRTGAAGRLRRSYQLGVLTGFRKKLDGERALAKAAADLGVDERQCHALVHVARDRVDRYVAHRYQRLGTAAPCGGLRDAASFSAGLEDGRSITIHKGIAEDTGRRGLLLPE